MPPQRQQLLQVPQGTSDSSEDSSSAAAAASLLEQQQQQHPRRSRWYDVMMTSTTSPPQSNLSHPHDSSLLYIEEDDDESDETEETADESQSEADYLMTSHSSHSEEQQQQQRRWSGSMLPLLGRRSCGSIIAPSAAATHPQQRYEDTAQTHLDTTTTSTEARSSSSGAVLQQRTAALQLPPSVLQVESSGSSSSSSVNSAVMAGSPSSGNNKTRISLLSSPRRGGGGGAVSTPSKSSSSRTVWQLLFGAAGIYTAYLCYGHVQEDLFSYRDADTGASFRSVWLLQTLESLANIAVGWTGRRVLAARRHASSSSQHQRQPPPQKLHLSSFFATGVSQLFAKTFTSMALAAGLSFPVCILCKSAKIVPVMLGQLLLGGSKYTARDYVFCSLVVGGTALLTAGSKKATGNSSSTAAGLLFIFISLVADGVTAGLQKRLLKYYDDGPRHHRPSPFDFMYYTNLAMVSVAATISMVATTDAATGLAFLQAHPAVLRMVLTACVCSAVGQSFVFYVVATFDPFVCSTITTTRKILSVLWSIVTKGHELSRQGGLGLALALTGLLVEVYGKATTSKKKTNTTDHHHAAGGSSIKKKKKKKGHAAQLAANHKKSERMPLSPILSSPPGKHHPNHLGSGESKTDANGKTSV